MCVCLSEYHYYRRSLGELWTFELNWKLCEYGQTPHTMPPLQTIGQVPEPCPKPDLITSFSQSLSPALRLARGRIYLPQASKDSQSLHPLQRGLTVPQTALRCTLPWPRLLLLHVAVVDVMQSANASILFGQCGEGSKGQWQGKGAGQRVCCVWYVMDETLQQLCCYSSSIPRYSDEHQLHICFMWRAQQEN